MPRRRPATIFWWRRSAICLGCDEAAGYSHWNFGFLAETRSGNSGKFCSQDTPETTAGFPRGGAKDAKHCGSAALRHCGPLFAEAAETLRTAGGTTVVKKSKTQNNYELPIVAVLP